MSPNDVITWPEFLGMLAFCLAIGVFALLRRSGR